MELFFDEADEGRPGGGARLALLDELGARPLSAADEEAFGYVFSLAPELDLYRRLIAGRAHLEEQPGDYAPLLDWRILGERIAGSSRAAVLRGRPAPTQLPSGWRGLALLRAPQTLLPSPPRVISDVETSPAVLAAAREELGEELQIVLPPRDCSLASCARRMRVWVYQGRVVAESVESWPMDDVLPAAQDFGPRAQEQAGKASAELARRWDCLTLVVDWFASPRGLVIYDAGPWSRALSEHLDLLRAVFGLLAGRSGGVTRGRGWRLISGV